MEVLGLHIQQKIDVLLTRQFLCKQINFHCQMHETSQQLKLWHQPSPEMSPI